MTLELTFDQKLKLFEENCQNMATLTTQIFASSINQLQEHARLQTEEEHLHFNFRCWKEHNDIHKLFFPEFLRDSKTYQHLLLLMYHAYHEQSTQHLYDLKEFNAHWSALAQLATHLHRLAVQTKLKSMDRSGVYWLLTRLKTEHLNRKCFRQINETLRLCPFYRNFTYLSNFVQTQVETSTSAFIASQELSPHA